ncbi:hypothetical protein [Gemmata sp.]|uniref:hypothetical protein n=1 Tax=Gemmata sp. TaxID=1914242 RepID=UPI003F70D53F
MSATVSGLGATAFTRLDAYPTRALDSSSLTAVDHSAPLLPTWGKLIDSVLDIHNLRDDWDGEGSEAPAPGAVDGALHLAMALRDRQERPADRVVPSVNGTVYFEWHLPDAYREIEVTGPSRAEVRIVQKGSDAVEAFVIGL